MAESKSEMVDRSGKGVPLLRTELRGTIAGSAADLFLTQTYRNHEQSPIEATFTFRMPGTTVCGFTCTYAGTKLVGRAREKQAAQSHYDDAIASGKTAFLAEWDQKESDSVTVSIGSLPPGEECAVETEFLQVLPSEGAVTKLVVPFVAALREGSATVDITATPSGRRVISVASPTHQRGSASAIEENGSSARFRAELPEGFSGNPFVLEVTEEDGPQREPTVIVERDPVDAEDVAVAVRFVPRIEDASDGHREFCFVVDCSGSMSGSRIASAKLALKMCLRGLPNDCTFNSAPSNPPKPEFSFSSHLLGTVVAFGSSFKSLWQSSKPYNETNFKEAETHVSTLSGDLGGTEILGPMKKVLEDPLPSGFSRQVFVLTDGEVSSPEETIHLCRSKANTTRVFSFGIGSDCGKQFINDIAKVTSGQSVFVTDNKLIPQCVMQQLSRATQPSFTDVSLTCTIPELVVTPRVLPPLFNGESFVAFGLTKKLTIPLEEISATMHAILPTGKAVAFTVRPSSVTTGSSVHKLAAAGITRQFTEPAYDALTRDLALRYNLLCKHTAFVVSSKTEGHGRATDNSMARHRLHEDVSNFDACFTQAAPSPSPPQYDQNAFAGFTFVSPDQQQAIANQDRDLAALEASVMQVHEMCANIGMELHEQGAMIDDIDALSAAPQKGRVSSFIDAIASAPKRLATWVTSNMARDSDRGRSAAAFDAAASYETPPPAATTGDVTADYTLMKVTGRGSFGKEILVRGKDGELRTMVVRKGDQGMQGNDTTSTFCGTPEYLPPEIILGAFSHGPVASLERLSKLQHRSIYCLKSFSVKERKSYCIFENNSGDRELIYILQSHKILPPEAVRFVIAELIVVTEYLNNEGLSLGKMSTEKIRLEASGHLRLDIQELTEVVPSGSHSAPTDIYTIGSIFFELLTGLPPFYSPDVQEMYKAITSGVLSFPGTIDPNAKSLLSSMLSRDPANRPGISALKASPFFSGIDWANIGSASPPVPLPSTQSAQCYDVSNIDPSFTSSPPVVSHHDVASTALGASATAPQTTLRPKFVELLLLCRFTGNWGIEDIAKWSNNEKATLMSAAPKLVDEDVWATVVALACFKVKFSDWSIESKPLVAKAQAWLAKATVSDLQSIEASADAFVASLRL